MVSRAAARVAALKEAVVADGTKLPARFDCSFDVCVSNFGLIFFAEPRRGVEEMLRVLRPGGTLLFSAWGGPELTEAFQLFPRAVAQTVPERLRPTSHKRIDGSPEVLRALLEAAGATDIRITGPVERTLTVPSAEAYFDRFTHGSPATHVLYHEQLDEATRRDLREAVMAPLRARFGEGPVSLPASAWLCAACK